MGAWIEIFGEFLRKFRGAWIEIMIDDTIIVKDVRRSPHGGRGLK